MPDEFPHIITRRASEHGWMRRPEMDTEYIDVWEMPNGQLYASPRGVHPTITTCAGGNLAELFKRRYGTG
jgi:hypothetical protein